jgi:glutamate dehydrogenase/leucine dehydrogenase
MDTAHLLAAAGIHADDLGPLKLVHVHRPGAGLVAVVAVDNVARGPAIGGTRMAPDVDALEAFRLARAMTLKNAAAGLPHGGAKSVIAADPRMPLERKELLVRAFADAIRFLEEYIPGPDMGTDETCMAWIHDETGRAAGLPRALGGIPLDEIGATGLGVAAAVEVAAEAIGLDLRGARVAVQGFGNAGRPAAQALARRGAVLVAASDSRGLLVSPDGLDVEALVALKRSGGSVVDHGEGRVEPGEAVVGVPCEIWIPAARPDVVTEENVERLEARIVAEAANIPVTPGAEAALHARGVLVLPDFIANAGGVICAAVEVAGGTESEALARIDEQIRSNVAAVLARSRADGSTPREAAAELAEERVRAAMRLRRFGA